MTKGKKPTIDAYIGKTFGRLTVQEFSHRIPGKKGYRYYFKCKCECGNETVVRIDQLKAGTIVSCGCYAKDINRERAKYLNRSHGLTNTRLYIIWSDMKARCYNPNNNSYLQYGGRGIKICDEWINDFKTFYDWAMDHGYRENLTIDRIDHEGNYCPENCRWTDQKNQQSNRRDNIYITYTEDYSDIGKGKIYHTYTQSDWARIINIDHKIIEYHLKHRNGRTINQVLEYCMDFGATRKCSNNLGFVIPNDKRVIPYPEKYNESYHD